MNEAPEHEPQWVDTGISVLLRAGVIASMTVVIAGLILTFVNHPHYISSKTALGDLTDARAEYPHRVLDVAAQIREGHGQALVMLGLLTLIATPVARVAFSVIAFALEGDRLYVVITSVVLVLLLVSFTLGAAG
ncbi:MAG TPA: DUF1634 domain-containing protein [Conexibacter sp.]|nr:DUF1634 domain-containing protein [Conexibacter sp.]